MSNVLWGQGQSVMQGSSGDKEVIVPDYLARLLENSPQVGCDDNDGIGYGQDLKMLAPSFKVS